MTPEEQLKNYELKIQELQAKKKQLLNRANEQKRKERTKRLIQVGALIEKYSCEITDLESFENYLKQYGYAITKTQSQGQGQENY